MATTAVPRTPPQTPHYPKFKSSPRRPLASPGSPASQVSIHPTETISPPKPPPEIIPPTGGVHVEELFEGDAGYVTDVDVVHPADFEDADTASEDESGTAEMESAVSAGEESDDDSDDEDNEGEGSDAGISRDFSRLGYTNDKEEAKFREKRRQRHWHKRTESRSFKRSHSQSVKSETVATDVDPESMADHDNGGNCVRRLRRRVRGPTVRNVVRESSAGNGSRATLFPSQTRRSHLSVERRERRLTPDGSEDSESDDDTTGTDGTMDVT